MLSLLLAAAVSNAGAPHFRLDYGRVGLPDCPDAAAFREQVDARLGYIPFDDDATRTLLVRLVAGSGGPQASVAIVEADGREVGRRSLAAAGCTDLATSLALTAAIAIDPRLAMTAPPAAQPDPDAVAQAVDWTARTVVFDPTCTGVDSAVCVSFAELVRQSLRARGVDVVAHDTMTELACASTECAGSEGQRDRASHALLLSLSYGPFRTLLVTLRRVDVDGGGMRRSEWLRCWSYPRLAQMAPHVAVAVATDRPVWETYHSYYFTPGGAGFVPTAGYPGLRGTYGWSAGGWLELGRWLAEGGGSSMRGFPKDKAFANRFEIARGGAGIWRYLESGSSSLLVGGGADYSHVQVHWGALEYGKASWHGPSIWIGSGAEVGRYRHVHLLVTARYEADLFHSVVPNDLPGGKWGQSLQVEAALGFTLRTRR